MKLLEDAEKKKHSSVSLPKRISIDSEAFGSIDVSKYLLPKVLPNEVQLKVNTDTYEFSLTEEHRVRVNAAATAAAQAITNGGRKRKGHIQILTLHFF